MAEPLMKAAAASAATGPSPPAPSVTHTPRIVPDQRQSCYKAVTPAAGPTRR